MIWIGYMDNGFVLLFFPGCLYISVCYCFAGFTIGTLLLCVVQITFYSNRIRILGFVKKSRYSDFGLE